MSDQVTDMGPAVCNGAEGSISGRICGGDGFWLTNASVSVEVGGVRIETTTDGDGYYTLNGVPSGTHTVTVVKGSFSATLRMRISRFAW